MGVISIIATLLKAAELAKKIKEVKDLVLPHPPEELQKYRRWFQCTVKNETQFALLYESTYFAHGKWFTAPGGTGAFTQVTFSGCNDDHGLAGVGVGCGMRIKLDEEHVFPVAIGLTSPDFGSYKAGVVESDTPKDGWDAATQQGNSMTSQDQYEARDQDGNETKIEFHVSAQPAKDTMLVVITQVRL